MKPTTIVELGVDYGYSTFVFATPNIGTVYGVDWFQGDQHTSFRNTYHDVVDFKNRHSFDNVEIIQATFDHAAMLWTKPIDILHIDGLHTYEAVRNDYHNWYHHVREGGAILFHDTESFPDGVGKVFNEITLPKLNFKHSAGLGVVSSDQYLINAIKYRFGHLL